MAELKWWQKAVFYQIYPRSFADGNGDGIGDIPGIIAHLDHLVDLGVDAIWLSPHYSSPQFDCGYDIADYTGVDPEYGTLDDFKEFLQQAHQRGLRVILDLVLNHTSDQHPWFLESKSSKNNPKRDWYIWRDGRDGVPPNNWNAAFDNCAWTYDSTTEQWYYHFFFAEQPDLNWRNPEVKQEMWKTVRFWLDLGVDGFRLDAIGTIFEHPDLPDHQAEADMLALFQHVLEMGTQNPYADPDPYLLAQRELMYKYQVDQPGIHELLRELRSLVDEYDNRVLVGEVDEIAYYGDGTNELHLVFNFPLMRTNRLSPAWIRKNQQERLRAMPAAAWPCNTLGNHDSPRVYSRYGDGVHNDPLARLSLALMLTLRGTPFLYNGEEIGMSDMMLSEIDQFRDNMGVWIYREGSKAQGVPQDVIFKLVQNITRDKCRTPMQWDNTPNAGFSPATVQTWLPVNPDHARGVNVREQRESPGSMLNFYKHLLAVRKSTPALIAGDYQEALSSSDTVFAFLRNTPEQHCLVVLNFSEHTQKISFDYNFTQAKLVYTSVDRLPDVHIETLEMAPYEILIADLTD